MTNSVLVVPAQEQIFLQILGEKKLALQAAIENWKFLSVACVTVPLFPFQEPKATNTLLA